MDINYPNTFRESYIILGMAVKITAIAGNVQKQFLMPRMVSGETAPFALAARKAIIAI